LLAILLAGAIGGVVAGVYLYSGSGHSNSKKLISVYKYSGLVAYKLPGSKPGTGMTFDTPKELVKISDTSGQAILQHNDIGYKAGKMNDAFIAVASAPGSMPDETLLRGMSRTMGDPSTATYKSMSSSLGQFVRGRIEPTKTSLSIGNAKPFTNSHIGANAWKFSISASEKGGKNPVKGEGVYVLGKKGYYYFMLTAVATDWQVDQEMWQKILNSLQVDQQ
jgi:hypothetical protein